MFILIGVDYIYSISDAIVNPLNSNITANFNNPLSTQAFQMYERTRDLFYTAITGILVPFLTFLSFASSFINRKQDLAGYLVSGMLIILITPLIIYVFSDIITNLLNVTILDTAYMATVYIQNFLFILVINMFLTLGSFIFVIRGGLRL